ALDVAHAAGLVHRDVKPANILLQTGRAYLADFGLARSASTVDSLTGSGGAGLSGTIGYVAPEQLEGADVGAQADQYSLTCVLYQCLAWHKPYERANDLAVVYAHLFDDPLPVSSVNRDIPRAVDGVIARGLAKRPDDRYGSCRAVVAALAEACGV